MLNATFTSDSLTGMSMCSGFSGALMMDFLPFKIRVLEAHTARTRRR